MYPKTQTNIFKPFIKNHQSKKLKFFSNLIKSPENFSDCLKKNQKLKMFCYPSLLFSDFFVPQGQAQVIK